MTATPSTYLPFSNNAELITLIESAETRRDFVYGLEKAAGREVLDIQKLNYHGRDYIGTRYENKPDGKTMFSLASVARNGMLVMLTFCFDQADFPAVAAHGEQSIIEMFLANVIFS